MTTTTTANRAASLAEKAILGFIAGGALAIGVVNLVFLGLHIAELVGSPSTTLYDLPLIGPMDAELGASAAVESAVYDRIDLTVVGLPVGAIAALVAAAVLTSLTTLAICGAVAWLCLRVFLGKPFVRSATWAIGGVAILVIAATHNDDVLVAIANAEAATLTGLDALPPFLFELDPAPIGWGVALAVIAGAFEIGQRMQRETEGLV